MSAEKCVGDAAIDGIAEGREPTERERRHLDSCDSCRVRLESARRDAGLLAELAASACPRVSSAADPAGADADAAEEIPGYRLLGEIHRGAQGAVMRAVQTATQRAVAVKVLHRGALATARQRQRFERETELLATLRHPNVVTVFDAGRTRSGGFFLAMELLEGSTLDSMLESERARGAFPPARRAALREALERFAALASGVAAIHRRGIIHRDLKPQNIIVDRTGAPHVIDFGVARPEQGDGGAGGGAGDGAGGSAGDSRLLATLEGEFVGTLAYAAPEQVAGDPALVDIRVDVYALGAILHRMLTGRAPIELTGSIAAVVDAIRSAEPAPPSRWNPAIDGELDRVVLQALAKDPAERYESAGALERDVRRHLAGDPVDAMRGGRLYLLRKALARHRAAVIVASLFFVMLLGFGITMAMLYAKANAANLARQDSLTAVLGILQSEDLHRRIDEETATRLLSRIEESLRGNLMEQPADAWAHFRELGLRQLRRGDHTSALRQFETALRMVHSADPGNRRAIADLHHQTGRALWFLRRYDEALREYEASLALERELHGEPSEAVAAGLTHLGATLRELGRLDEAEAAQRRALEMRRRLHGPDDPRYGASLNNLGVLLRERGRHEEAISLFEQALRIARASDAGVEGIGAALHNLGLAQARLGRRDDAVRSLEEAIAIKRRELEDDHPSVVSSQNELARLRGDASTPTEPGAAPPAPTAPARTPPP
ncbi:MAG: tetratricopeptide repeat protein [Phycisphaerae bacterium]|nr:tetratricopeptide repeat protein [Phycisphaerae bacterium]